MVDLLLTPKRKPSIRPELHDQPKFQHHCNLTAPMVLDSIAHGFFVWAGKQVARNPLPVDSNVLEDSDYSEMDYTDELPKVDNESRIESKKTRQAKSLLELVDHFPGKVLCWASDLIYEEGKI